MRFLLFFFLIVFSSCSVSEPHLGASDVPIRPERGYPRLDYFFPYYTPFFTGLESFPIMQRNRTWWLAKSQQFELFYPHLPVKFNYFQNTSPENSFSFVERLFFSDVFDLVRYTVNSPIFEQQMRYRTFYENDGVTPKSAVQVIQEIKAVNFAVTLAKRSLGEGIVAEASVGGFLHTIWVRNDVNYSRESVNHWVAVILHELTHNMGYSHSSQINYGVHIPVQEALRLSEARQVQQFIEHTPYYENKMIDKVLHLVSSSVAYAKNKEHLYTISCSLHE